MFKLIKMSKRTIRKLLMISAVGTSVVGCMSETKLAQKCKQRFPCTETSIVIDSSRIDSVTNWKHFPIDSIHPANIKCFQIVGDSSKRIDVISVPVVGQTRYVETTITVKDSAQIRLFQVQMDSAFVKLAEAKDLQKSAQVKYDKLQASYSGWNYFWKICAIVEFVLLGGIVGFLIYKATKKVNTNVTGI